MSMLVQLVGVVLGVCGALTFGSPELARGAAQWLEQEARVRPVALLVAIAGAVLVAGAAATRWPAWMQVLGGLFVAAGLLGVFLGAGGSRRLLRWWRLAPRFALRAWGVVTGLVGVLIVFAAR